MFDLDEVHPIAGPPGRLLLLLVRCDAHAAPFGVVDLGSPVTGLAWSRGLDLLGVACADGSVAALPRIEGWDGRTSAGQWDATDQL